ncbi:MAG: hypothetical protein WC635_08745 [Bacteriovorax sp.]|jgi:hypothetical protein
MKILMTLIMTVAATSAFAADCKLGSACSEADCKALNKDYAIMSGKCTNPKANETETQCAGIVSTSGAKGSTDAAGSAGKPAAEGASK